MTEQRDEHPRMEQPDSARVIVVGPDAMAVEPVRGGDGRRDDDGPSVTEMVEQPAKVMRIGTMIKQLLEEVRNAPLDEASRRRLREIHTSSIKELKSGLAPELGDELSRLSQRFCDESVPSEAELRVAHAQLVGWLEGLFQGIQTALVAQQMAARQLEEMRRRSLPRGVGPAAAERPGSTGQYL